MNGNYRIVEHRTRYSARRAWRFTQQNARDFWQSFMLPVLIVATGVALASPIAKMAGTTIGFVIYMLER